MFGARAKEKVVALAEKVARVVPTAVVDVVLVGCNIAPPMQGPAADENGSQATRMEITVLYTNASGAQERCVPCMFMCSCPNISTPAPPALHAIYIENSIYTVHRTTVHQASNAPHRPCEMMRHIFTISDDIDSIPK